MKPFAKDNTNNKNLECLNCGKPLSGDENFCSECGQKNINRVSVFDLVSNFFSGFFAFDNQFFRTLKPLLFNPGKVASNYINGKRKRYTNPFVFLLHTTILYFIFSGLINLMLEGQNAELLNEKTKYETQQKINHFFNENKQISFFKDTLHSKLAKEKALQILVQDINAVLVKDSTKYKKAFVSIESTSKTTEEIIDQKLYDLEIDYRLDIVKKDSITLYKKERINYDTINSKFSKMGKYSREFPYKPILDALDYLQLKPTSINIFLYRNIKKFSNFTISTNEKSFRKSFASKLPMGLFILLPLFALVFSLIYIRHPYRYTEHLIFLFYLQATVFWLILTSIILDAIILKTIGNKEFVLMLTDIVILLALLVVVFKSLHYFYKQSFIKTFIKLFFLTLSYIIVGLLGGIVLSFIAILV